MAILQDIEIAPNVWQNLNTLSGIVGGTAISIQNVGNGACRVWTGASAPSGFDYGFFINPVQSGLGNATINVDAGDPDVWILARQAGAKVSVAEG